MNNRTSAGFTLIELMIVVAIIGILAAIAIPQYNQYVARSQFSECNQLFAGARTPVEDYIYQRGIQEAAANIGSVDELGELLGIDVAGQYAGLNAPEYDGDSVILGCEFGAGAEGVPEGTDMPVSGALDGRVLRFELHSDGSGNRHWRCAANQDFTAAELERLGGGLCP